MRARQACAVIPLLIVGLVLTAQTVSAAAPVPVVITAHPCSFTPETGPWDASGAIADSGTYLRSAGVGSPPTAGFGENRTARETFAYTGSAGSFVVRTEEWATAADEQVGVWEISSGTGAYESSSGHGQAFFSSAPDASCFFTFTLVGVMGKVTRT